MTTFARIGLLPIVITLSPSRIVGCVVMVSSPATGSSHPVVSRGAAFMEDVVLFSDKSMTATGLSSGLESTREEAGLSLGLSRSFLIRYWIKKAPPRTRIMAPTASASPQMKLIPVSWRQVVSVLLHQAAE